MVERQSGSRRLSQEVKTTTPNGDWLETQAGGFRDTVAVAPVPVFWFHANSKGRRSCRLSKFVRKRYEDEKTTKRVFHPKRVWRCHQHCPDPSSLCVTQRPQWRLIMYELVGCVQCRWNFAAVLTVLGRGAMPSATDAAMWSNHGGLRPRLQIVEK